MSLPLTQLSLFPQENTSESLPAVRAARCRPGDLWALGRHRLLCGDCTDSEQVKRLMGEMKAAMCFADPPYGLGIDKWDRPVDNPAAWLALLEKHLLPESFLVLCNQMPYALRWLSALEGSPFRYKDHVVWVKREVNAVALPLNRTHESVFIYSLGKARYLQTKGRYEDVKLPGVLVDIVTLEGIDRHIKDLRVKVQQGHSSLNKTVSKRHDSYRYMPKTSDRSPAMANFTNVWSFLPEHHRTINGSQDSHATAKPVALVERAIALCSPEKSAIYDPYLGSGTTLMACERTGRACFGCEIEPAYCDVILARWEQATGKHAQVVERL